MGVVTIAEGSPRVLRGTTWFRLVAGARLQEGDILVATGTGQVQVELFAGGAFNLGAPGSLFAASLPITGDKATGLLEFSLPAGWLKLAALGAAPGVQIQFEGTSLNATTAIAVIHAQPGGMELFIESGAATLIESGAGGKAPTTTEMKAGEFAARSADRPLRFDRRAPAAFVTTIPRHLIDPLPTLAAKFKSTQVQWAAEQEITYAEAEPWLSGPWRKLFLKRFQPRLKDREFRAAVEAQIARYPEWDRLLHPEKYAPKRPAVAK